MNSEKAAPSAPVDAVVIRRRELLERWLGWWEGPARDFGLHNLPIIPPITDTRKELACMICAGIEEDGICAACGRVMHGPPIGG